MTESTRAAIVYQHSRVEYVPVVGARLADADRNARDGFLVPGQLWDRVGERTGTSSQGAS